MRIIKVIALFTALYTTLPAHSMLKVFKKKPSIEKSEKEEAEKERLKKERELVAKILCHEPNGTNSRKYLTESLDKRLQKMQEENPEQFAAYLQQARQASPREDTP